MAKLIVCAAKAYAGVKHRYVMLRQVRAFALRFGYGVRFLWGVTRGVSDCRHEELFAPIPGVDIRNISAGELAALQYFCQKDGGFTYKGEPLYVLRDVERPVERFFSWDLVDAETLSRRVPRPYPPLHARPCHSLQSEIDAYVRANGIRERLGIRVRVTESFTQRGKLHRVQSEIDHVLYALYRIPWYVKVFIATDSEYVQKTLLAHFRDAKFLPKRFDLAEATGRYVHRADKTAMKTFLKEVGCLCACRKIINVGGFLNEGLVQSKLLKEPYEEAAFLGVRRV
jgi:hypothetical protein